MKKSLILKSAFAENNPVLKKAISITPELEQSNVNVPVFKELIEDTPKLKDSEVVSYINIRV